MAIREDIVASAAQFLQDPSVASSSVENRIAFLRSKNLTQEEIDAALARTGAGPPPPQSAPYPSAPPQYYQQFPQNAWQPPVPPPRRDWRDWFIMATVVGGVSYGLYALGKRYVMPLVAPPTPEKLEQDKKTVEEQFDRAFSLVEQLAKDTETLKNAEQQRTERLDTALSDLESVMSDLKSANRRREDDAQRVRDEVQSLKDAIPKAMDNQKEMVNERLREVNAELKSLKTLVSQRMNSSSGLSQAPPVNPLRQASESTAPTTFSGAVGGDNSVKTAPPTPSAETPKPQAQPASGVGRTLNGNTSGKASIPAWQMAFASQNEGDASTGSESKDASAAS